MGFIDREYKVQNMQNMVKDFIKQMVSKEREKFHNETHNNSPVNRTEAPRSSTKEFKTLKEQFTTERK